MRHAQQRDLLPKLFKHQEKTINWFNAIRYPRKLHLNLSFLETSQCHPNPCENGGTCRDEDAVDSHQSDWWCECPKGYSGRRCHGMFVLNAEVDD